MTPASCHSYVQSVSTSRYVTTSPPPVPPPKSSLHPMGCCSTSSHSVLSPCLCPLCKVILHAAARELFKHINYAAVCLEPFNGFQLNLEWSSNSVTWPTRPASAPAFSLPSLVPHPHTELLTSPTQASPVARTHQAQSHLWGFARSPFPSDLSRVGFR